jgi:type VI secretion system protein ImpE
MDPVALYREGRLNEAIAAAGAKLRDNPSDSRLRTFLFELLCFAGQFDRAEKHLALLGDGDQQRELGALLYRGAIAAELTRIEMFSGGAFPATEVQAEVAGTLNGTPFSTIEDADPRIGPRLEVFAAGSYMWIPFEHVFSLDMEAPKKLRDLLWTPGRLTTGPGFGDKDMGEVLLPAIACGSSAHADDAVRLGRATVYEGAAGAQIPLGQKVLLVDGEEFPFLEVRSLRIGSPEEGADAAE